MQNFSRKVLEILNTCGITPLRLPSGGFDSVALASGQHSSEETLQR